MLIKYIDSSSPAVERVCDTKQTYAENINILRGFGSNMTQEMWDKNEALRFSSLKHQGKILSYQCISETEATKHERM